MAGEVVCAPLEEEEAGEVVFDPLGEDAGEVAFAPADEEAGDEGVAGAA